MAWICEYPGRIAVPARQTPRFGITVGDVLSSKRRLCRHLVRRFCVENLSNEVAPYASNNEALRSRAARSPVWPGSSRRGFHGYCGGEAGPAAARPSRRRHVAAERIEPRETLVFRRSSSQHRPSRRTRPHGTLLRDAGRSFRSAPRGAKVRSFVASSVTTE
jgi:hypothetical protein